MIGGSFSKEIIDFFNQITFFYREIYLHNYIQKLTSTCIFFISPKFTHPLNRFVYTSHKQTNKIDPLIKLCIFVYVSQTLSVSLSLILLIKNQSIIQSFID